GKSTLLHLLGALDQPTRGDVRIAGERLAGRSDEDLSSLRNRSIGFVFQFHHLLREFSALENVMMPLRIAGWDDDRAKRRAEELLARVGLAGRVQHRPSELSGGEQQRTAVARALSIDPVVLLADEPSGNLDHMNSERLHDLFVELSRDLEIAMVIATHNRSLAARADRTLLLEDGRLTNTDVRETVP
ncbi:MAG TPA: ABC transporter ATP-binding protein, partial [Gemmatimonadaceae bacterium]|nr:ABC transporter ATP-binding protein [Gemmatimonadaceae bacterium]